MKLRPLIFTGKIVEFHSHALDISFISMFFLTDISAAVPLK
jgi:hypothetical protein